VIGRVTDVFIQPERESSFEPSGMCSSVDGVKSIISEHLISIFRSTSVRSFSTISNSFPRLAN